MLPKGDKQKLPLTKFGHSAMPRSGITIIEEQPGPGREVQPGDRVRICYSITLNRGDSLVRDRCEEQVIGDREVIAGFRYGLEGMRDGGCRKFKASPHLCYRDQQAGEVPPNAVLIVNVQSLEIVA